MLNQEGDLGIRLMRDELADYELMARWLTDERVLEFFGGRDNPQPLGKIQEKYGPRVQAAERVVPCIIELRGEPIGYVQFYPVVEADGFPADQLDGAHGIDVFIGEPDLWDQGIGTRVMRVVVGHLFQDHGAQRLFIDPGVNNPRAVRCYEKAGFRKVGIMPKHELHEGEWCDCWQMICDPPERG